MIPTALVPEGGRLFPVGRLDQDSEGLLVLTNDGALGRPRAAPAARHRARIRHRAAVAARPAEQAAALKAGIPLDEGLATLTGLRATTDIETRRLGELHRAATRAAGLVPGDPGAGLEAPAAPDVRCRRCAGRAAGPRPDRAGPARRPAERPGAAAAGTGGPWSRGGRGDEPSRREVAWRRRWPVARTRSRAPDRSRARGPGDRPRSGVRGSSTGSPGHPVSGRRSRSTTVGSRRSRTPPATRHRTPSTCPAGR